MELPKRWRCLILKLEQGNTVYRYTYKPEQIYIGLSIKRQVFYKAF